jgi:ubiquitin-protein ligase E3 C
MLPVFGDDRKRKINLGGASSASSRSAILDQAQARRNERVEQKKKHENAVKLQAWWRGLRQERMARKQMRKSFENDVVGMTGLRCLVLIGRRDEEALAIWSSRMVESGAGMSVLNEVYKGELMHFQIRCLDQR